MALSPLISKTSLHARSISLPSRPHPITDQFNEQLCTLRSSQTASTSSSSISHRLSGLKNLFSCVDDLLLLASNQQDLQANCINIMLDGSLRLLDICGTARDALLQTKEHIQNIQSVLRRRCSGELSIDNEVAQYLSARKQVKKAIKNCLRDIKKANKYDETSTMVPMYKDVEVVTEEIFSSLLTHIAGPKKGSWSLIRKLVHQASEKKEAASISDFEDLDAALTSLIKPRIQVHFLHFIQKPTMAASVISKTVYHARSLSLPSRPHPIADQFDEHLCRLRSSQTASTSNSSSINQSLSGLKNFFNCVDELLLLPSNQKDCKENCVNIMLDGSVRLLDICGAAKDALMQTKEQIQTIQAVLRRRCSGELSIDNEIAHYLSARKKVKKAIKNCLRDIKKVDKNDEHSAMVDMFKDVEAVTVEIFKSLLIHIAGSKPQSKKSSWSLFRMLVHHQGSEKEEATSISKFEDLDATLSSLICRKKKTGINMLAENLRNQMEKLEYEIQNVDGVLENLFRHLVKTRTALLNILSN